MNTFFIISRICVLLFLFFCALSDARRGTVPLLYALPGAAAGIATGLMSPGVDALFMAAGLLPGAAMVLFSFLSGQGLGLGDAMVYCVAGIYTGWFSAMMLIILSLVLAAFHWVLRRLMLRRKPGLHIRLIPYILAAFVVLLVFARAPAS